MNNSNTTILKELKALLIRIHNSFTKSEAKLFIGQFRLKSAKLDILDPSLERKLKQAIYYAEEAFRNPSEKLRWIHHSRNAFSAFIREMMANKEWRIVLL